MKPNILVTNDDGIESGFLHELVEALQEDFRVSVAAPATEQSWIGRAMSRRGELRVVERTDLFPQIEKAWSISGTPTDCVNIALGHLLGEKPDLVVSGINIGYNTTEALILSSGTIAGAFEGALWDLPAIAFSQFVPSDLFVEISAAKGRARGEFFQSLRAAAGRARGISLDALASPPPTGTVINVNFPAETGESTPIRETRPAKVALGSLFEEHRPGVFRFRFHRGMSIESDPDCDRSALEEGCISYGLLDFSKIGRHSFRDKI